MPKSIAIIGAGIAGLVTGCYARMNGYDTLIVEQHDRPGGLCTAWTRHGYTVDGCIHHLAGCDSSSYLARIWRELGPIAGRPILFRDRLVSIEDHTGQRYDVLTDIDRLEEHLLTLSPADRGRIVAFTGAARRLLGCDLLSAMAGGRAEQLRLLARANTLLRWGRKTMQGYGEGFQSPFLRRAFPLAQYGFPGIPVLIHLNFLAGCHRRDLGWPHGGSLAFARALERRYRDLGGEILYRVPARRTMLDGPRATGVRIATRQGEEDYRADVVVSAADAHATVYDLLGERYVTDRVRRYFEAEPDHLEMSVHVSFGIAHDLRGRAPALSFLLPEARDLAGCQHDHLDVEVYPSDTGLAPEGKTVLKVMLRSRYAYWSDLARERTRYEEAKQCLAAEVLSLLEEGLPEISGRVEMIDVATPLTTARYTGNYHGAQVWAAPSSFLPRGVARYLPRIDGFYMVGQWASGSVGISTAAAAGRRLVTALCRRDGRRSAITNVAAA